MRVRSRASGRVNLIGDHTDYMGGLAMPMPIDRSTVVEGTREGRTVSLRSDADPDPAEFALPVGDPAGLRPRWARYPAAVAAELDASRGFRGTITSTVPPGAGLSSSASLEIAVALALGFGDGAPEDPVELARLCQRAEHRAVGVPSGLMDQLCICTGREGHATLIDFSSLEVTQVAIPAEARIWVVHSGRSRSLDSSLYADRRRSAEAAAALLGPLPDAEPDRIESLADPLLARRARHVRSECERVARFASHLAAGDLRAAGAEMTASHESLRDDYEVSAPELDVLVDELCGAVGVHGARLTGAGFGGCAVALASPGFHLDSLGGSWRGWEVRAVDGTEVRLG